MFSKHARTYLALGLAVMPCHGKRPALRRWKPLQARLPTALEVEDWIRQHPAANIGTVTGAVSMLTIVDIDARAHIENAIAMFGDTPLKVATPRGGMHLYFRFNGEGNATKINGTPIDIRGQGGFIVLPPSVNPDTGTAYRLIGGDYTLLPQLPAANRITIQKATRKAKKPLPSIADGEVVEEGQRNEALFNWLREKAFACDTLEMLMDAAQATNNLFFTEPLPDAEVQATVNSVWRYKLAGNLKRPGQQFAALDGVEFNGLIDKPRAFQLLAFLKQNHDGLRREFCIMDAALAPRLQCSADTVRDARLVLLQRKFIKLVYQGGGGPGDASRYCFP